MWEDTAFGAAMFVVAAFNVIFGVFGVAKYRARRQLHAMVSMEGQAALYRFAEQLRRQARA